MGRRGPRSKLDVKACEADLARLRAAGQPILRKKDFAARFGVSRPALRQTEQLREFDDTLQAYVDRCRAEATRQRAARRKTPSVEDAAARERADNAARAAKLKDFEAALAANIAELNREKDGRARERQTIARLTDKNCQLQAENCQLQAEGEALRAALRRAGVPLPERPAPAAPGQRPQAWLDPMALPGAPTGD